MKNPFAGAGAWLGWFAIIAQFVLIILNRTADVPETIIRFFSYFTILSNILVTLCFTALWIRPKSAWGKFFISTKVVAGIVVYIIVVGLIYNVVLRQLSNLHGFQKIVDLILHSIIPVFFTVYWLFQVPKKQLKWKNAFVWLLFPFFYILFVLIRGTFSNFYPYPFINVSKSGYATVLLNCGGLFFIFLLLSFLIIGYGKLVSKYFGKS